MTDLQPGADPRSCFGSVADAYDRGRPSYPTQAAAWLVGGQPATVLELGAGTGKLTEVSDDPDDDEPHLVTVPGGATWWYQHGQLV